MRHGVCDSYMRGVAEDGYIMEEKINIVDLTRVTAKNLYEMLTEISNHIEKLQTENAELKRKLNADTDDLK